MWEICFQVFFNISSHALAMQTPLLLTNVIHTLGRALQKPSIALQNCREKSEGFSYLKDL